MSKFFTIFTVIVLTSLVSNLSFGQSQPVCGWNRVDSNTSPTIKNSLASCFFTDTGKIEIFNNPGPSGGSKSLKFSNIGGPAEQGFICWWKAYNLSTDGDSFSICLDAKAFDDSLYGAMIQFRVISQGKTYETIWDSWSSNNWARISYKMLTPRDANGKACQSLDTLSIFMSSNDPDLCPSHPFGMLIDNLKILKLSSGQLVLFDSCGESQGVEEESGILNKESGIRIYPNPFSFECYFQGSEKIDIYDISGKRVKTLLKERIWNGKDELGKQLPNGIYFAKTQIGNKTVTTKLTLLK